MYVAIGYKKVDIDRAIHKIIQLDTMTYIPNSEYTVNEDKIIDPSLVNSDELITEFGAIAEDNSNSVPLLFISDAEVIEGNSENNNNYLEFKVTLDRPATESVFVMMQASGYLPSEYDYYLPGDVADWDDMYYPTMESLIFEPGETEKTFSVPVYSDLEIENDEEVFASVSYFDGNIEIADGLGIGTIINDDGVLPKLSISDAEIVEGDEYSEGKYLEFEILLDRLSTSEITIGLNGYDFGEDLADFNYWLNNYEYLGDESRASYNASPNFASFLDDYYYPLWDTQVTFAPGETKKTYRVDINPERDSENDEEFYLRIEDILVTTENGEILENERAIGEVLEVIDGVGVGKIIDDDFETTTIYRVNVGGGRIADDLLDWSADTSSNPSPYRVGSGGTGLYRRPEYPISLAAEALPDNLPEAIFKTERWDRLTGQNMQWEFDVDAGDYEVRLYFAEIYKPIDAVGKRVFDVKVEGSVPEVFDDIDVFASVGFRSAMMLSHTLTVSDGSLSLEFIHEIQNPALKGIEILAVNEGFL